MMLLFQFFLLFIEFLFLCDTKNFGGRRFLHRHSLSSQKYRISPTTGVRIALPTPEQLAWQAQELGVLIHFNMATFLDEDGCSEQMAPDISLFNPYRLNTDNWVQTMVDFGAKYAVLVAKHGCGFHMAPTDVKFPLNPSGQIIPYNYSINFSPLAGRDVLGEFVQSCQKRQIKTGFYYTVVSNTWLNVESGYVQNRTIKPGQMNVTQDTYDKIVLQQLREIWTRYGSLHEIWFDGGYTQSLKQPIIALLEELQPRAVAFNGYGVSKNPARWIGTEAGAAPDPNWSTGTDDGGGDPDSPIFCPGECDTTLQNQDRWFWNERATLRPLSELIQVYHETVGRNCILMLDLTPDRTGLIPPAYAQRYKELGDFIRSCYDTSVKPSEYFPSDDSLVHLLLFNNGPITVDRSVIREDQSNGQVIRSYIIDVQLTNSTETKNGRWLTVAQGTSIGNKKIDLWPMGPILINAVRLTLTEVVDTPSIKSFTVHLCN